MKPNFPRSNPLKLALLLALLLAAGCLSLHAAAQETPVAEKTSYAEDRKASAVTIYNESLALVREERQLFLGKGLNSIAMREVSAMIRPETASLRNLDGAPFMLLEQNFDFDLLTPAALLEKYVGKTVTIIQTDVVKDEKRERREKATILSANSGIVLKFSDRIETGLPPDARIVYDELPANLRDRPTLVMNFNAAEAGKHSAELSYLTGGMSWKADYVATLSRDESALDLAGWVTLTNRSGATYENTRLQLVAGDVNRVRQDVAAGKDIEHVLRAVQEAPQMAHEELFEYHLYSLGFPTTLRNNQTKQVALLSAASVPVRKEYRMQGASHWYRAGNASPERGDKRKVDVFVEFDNRDGGLGQPLPKGTVRVYKNDSKGHALFIGEDQIDHTPKNEQVRLKLGSAFDVTGVWKLTNYTKISDKIHEMSVSVEIQNGKDIPVTVRVVEPVPGDWKMLKENLAHQKTTASTATWDVPVPANDKNTLTYRVRVKW